MTFTYSWFCFQIKKQDSDKKCEDASEGDPEENTAGNNFDMELKDKYETILHN